MMFISMTYNNSINFNLIGCRSGADPGILERGAPKGASHRKFLKIRYDFLQSGICFWDQNGCRIKIGPLQNKKQ